MPGSPAFNRWKAAHPVLWALVLIAAASAVLVVAVILSAAALFISRTPAGSTAGAFFASLVAGSPANSTWYITRAAGLVAFFLLWLSTLWGLWIPTRMMNGKLHGSYTLEFHQATSLLALGFTGLHMFILLFDTFTPFTLAQVLVPFTSDYRPLWVGLGILSLYISALVTVTFYLRRQIGGRAFRLIHALSLLGFFGAAAHGLLSGTDSSLVVMKIIYAASSISVGFMFFYWLAEKMLTRSQAGRPARQPSGGD